MRESQVMHLYRTTWNVPTVPEQDRVGMIHVECARNMVCLCSSATSVSIRLSVKQGLH